MSQVSGQAVAGVGKRGIDGIFFNTYDHIDIKQ